MSDDRHDESTANGGGWQPHPQGEYDSDATAFVQLPEGMLDTPLAAPGHGYVPPQITVTPTTADATDPAATGAWVMPPEVTGSADGGRAVRWPDPDAAPAHPVAHRPAESQEYDPRATGQWSFAEAEAAEQAYGQEYGQGHGHAHGHGGAAPSSDVTGQWSIPVADGDLPDESGEFTASSLAVQWGRTPPATLPGGAPAPWATEAGAGAPWGVQAPEEDVTHARETYPESPAAPAPVEERPESRFEQTTLLRAITVPSPSEERPVEERPAAEGVEGAPGVEAVEEPVAESAGEAPEAHAAPQALEAPVAHEVPRAHEAPEPVVHEADTVAEPVESAEPGQHVEHAEHVESVAELVEVPESVEAPDAPDAPDEADEADDAPVAAEAVAEAAVEVAVEAVAPHAVETPGPTDLAEAPEPGVSAEPGEAEETGDPGEPDPAEALAATGPAPLHDDHPLVSYVLSVNGTDRPVTDAWIGESLLYVLRERLGLAGAKDGCSQGECGACNVQVDGRLVASCLVPAATTAGSEIRTVEGLAVDGQPSDVQRALAACGAVQCGFCVPGMAMTVHDLLEGNPAPSDLETRRALCGNLCRCSGYRGVLDAVREVVAEREASASAEPAAQDGRADEARIPHQAGPGAGGVHQHAHDGTYDAGHGGGYDAPEGPQGPYGQDGGQA
ncbi:2Fe-2S iron-sulfur cluster-binding protein [Streptomyces sp. NPDC052114]|uniref:2Fe-2S iron-sulfur cluster-binding protein n=1 Tax=unclassified Streptomyces TaxID=2593676 RepID=UPI0034199579